MSLINRALGHFDTPYATEKVKPGEITLAKAKIDPRDLAVVRDKLRKLYPPLENEKIVLLNVNASDLLPQRRWLPGNFIKVSRKILNSFRDVLVVATGASEEWDDVEEVVRGIADARCVNSAGVFDFNELIPLYSLAVAMLTNDSGPAHFASVTSLEIFVIFGPETPSLYGPLGNAESIYLGLPCSPCVSAANHRKTTCQPRPCLTGITPEMVEKRMITYLDAALN